MNETRNELSDNEELLNIIKNEGHYEKHIEVSLEFYIRIISKNIRTYIFFDGITRIDIGKIPKNTYVNGIIKWDNVEITNNKNLKETFKILIQSPILIFDKEKI